MGHIVHWGCKKPHEHWNSGLLKDHEFKNTTLIY